MKEKRKCWLSVANDRELTIKAHGTGISTVPGLVVRQTVQPDIIRFK